MQYDLDFLLSPEHAGEAWKLLRDRGYRQLSSEAGPTDHLPPLVRKTGWEWRGDFFDVEIPAAIELHYRLWDTEFERIPIQPRPDPLSRLEMRDGCPVLCLQDQLLHCVLHFMRHLFRGSVRLSHLYEIAWFLDQRASDAGFWSEWTAEHSPETRVLAATCFRLASQVFNCPTGAIEGEIGNIPAAAARWLQYYWRSVVMPDKWPKAEVLLQVSLAPRRRDWPVILRRRLLPLSFPGPVDALYLPPEQLTLRRRVVAGARHARYAATRAGHHLRGLASFVRLAALRPREPLA